MYVEQIKQTNKSKQDLDQEPSERRNTMNIQKFTQKSIEAVNQCEKLAMEYGNPARRCECL